MMKRRYLLFLAVLAVLFTAAWSALHERGAESYARTSAPATTADNAKIAQLVAQVLARSHYAGHAIDDKVAADLFDEYLKALDPQRLFFLQSDIQEFMPLQNTLDDKIQRGDIEPAILIFNRLKERMRQQDEYVTELLKNEKFDFTTNETVLIDRKDAPRPANLDEAHKLWDLRLRYEALQQTLNGEKAEKIVSALRKRYERQMRAISQLDNDDVLQIYLTSLASAYDPHSAYMGRASLENFGIDMQLAVVGIGAQLTTDDDGYAKIMELIPGGPAQRSGKIKPGDRITAVAQAGAEPVDVVDMKLDNVVAMIRGKKGTEVGLTILPADAPDLSVRKAITLMRDEVKIEEREAKAEIVDLPAQTGQPKMRIGIINVPSFYGDMDRGSGGGTSTTAHVAALLKKLKAENVQGLILDLRTNPGGFLDEAVRLTGLFIPKGPVVQVRDSDSTVEVEEDENPGVAWGGPMVVLTSKFSASASEILAGALQDYGRAVIVGDTSTHGKGTVQAVLELGPIMRRAGAATSVNPGALRLTVQKFYRPSGSSTQLKGVVPDIVLPSLTSLVPLGEATLDHPLPWDTIAPAKFQPINSVKPILPGLIARSQTRIAGSKDFAYLKQEMAQVRERINKKWISLNYDKRLAEKKTAEARADARKKELSQRPPLGEVVYEVTVKQAGQPGLPKPLSSKPVAVKEKPEDADEDSVDPAPQDDILLNETKRILADVIQMSRKAK